MIFKSLDVHAVGQQVNQMLEGNHIKYDCHSFSSRVVIIDIWHKGLFYVVQIENEFIGISRVDEESSGFNLNPDRKFLNSEDFFAELKSII